MESPWGAPTSGQHAMLPSCPAYNQLILTNGYRPGVGGGLASEDLGPRTLSQERQRIAPTLVANQINIIGVLHFPYSRLPEEAEVERTWKGWGQVNPSWVTPLSGQATTEKCRQPGPEGLAPMPGFPGPLFGPGVQAAAGDLGHSWG